MGPLLRHLLPFQQKKNRNIHTKKNTIDWESPPFCSRSKKLIYNWYFDIIQKKKRIDSSLCKIIITDSNLFRFKNDTKSHLIEISTSSDLMSIFLYNRYFLWNQLWSRKCRSKQELCHRAVCSWHLGRTLWPIKKNKLMFSDVSTSRPTSFKQTVSQHPVIDNNYKRKNMSDIIPMTYAPRHDQPHPDATRPPHAFINHKHNTNINYLINLTVH